MLNLFYALGDNMMSTITATPNFKAIHPILLANAAELDMYRSRRHKHVDAFIDEVSAARDKKHVV